MTALRAIARLRSLRVRGEPDLGLEAILRPMALKLRREAKRRGDAVDRWAELVPAHLRRGVTLGKVVRGVLTVHCAHPTTRAALDRWLAGGGQTQLNAAGLPRVATSGSASRSRATGPPAKRRWRGP